MYSLSPKFQGWSTWLPIATMAYAQQIVAIGNQVDKPWVWVSPNTSGTALCMCVCTLACSHILEILNEHV